MSGSTVTRLHKMPTSRTKGTKLMAKLFHL